MPGFIRSWLGSALAAELGKMPRRLRSLVAHSARLEVSALRDLERKGDVFHIQGDSPTLSLVGDIPRGFVEVRVTACASKPTWITLSAHNPDRSATEVTLLGQLGESTSTVRAFCAIPDTGTAELRPVPFEGTLAVSEVSIRPASPLEIASRLKTVAPDWRELRHPRRLWDLARDRLRRPDPRVGAYNLWCLFNERSAEELEELREQAAALAYRPKFSVIVPVYAPERWALERCIASVKEQVYPNWELCIADDASPQPWIREYLERVAAEDSRIRVVFRQENGHISAASNSALELATGEFVALLDNDDELAPDALYEVACALNREPDLDLVYSDEDKIDEHCWRLEGRFKPDWSPELLLSQMYIGHIGVYRRSLVQEIGGFRKGYEGSQDHDLALRFTERTQRVRRVPRVLYHWRVSATSTAAGHGAKPYAIDAARRALEDALVRRGRQGRVEARKAHPGYFTVHYDADPMQTVSVILPSTGEAARIERCLSSLNRWTKHPNWEVCVVACDGGMVELLSHWKQLLGPDRLRVVRSNETFNRSHQFNVGAQATRGQLLLLLDEDVEVGEDGWMQAMAGYARQPELGAIGCRIVHPEGSLRSAGLILDDEHVVVHAQQFLPAEHPGYFGQFVSTTNFSAISGECLMIRRDTFQRVGGFDEQLECPFADADFCLRVQTLGLRNAILGHVRVVQHKRPGRDAAPAAKTRDRLNSEAAILRQRWARQLPNDPATNPNLNPIDYSLRIARTRRSG